MASSDLDLLVDLLPIRNLFDLIGMKQELEAVTGFNSNSLSSWQIACVISRIE